MRTRLLPGLIVLVAIPALILTACNGEATTSPATYPATTEPTTAAPDTTPAGEPTTTPPTTSAIPPEFAATLESHFGFMPAFIDFEGARAAGGAYDRPHFELFQWGMIERSPGHFDFMETDNYVQQAQQYGMHILANIQPFAGWDQAQCHQDLEPPDQPGETVTKGPPCDLEAYRQFVIRLVERYDGDGVDDMPGLTYPIKHWEVMNEPEFSTGDLIFFQGNAADYYEILRVTYEAVKAADPEAWVVQGGMAGMMDIDAAFWQEVFDRGGAAYIDILNMHSIGHGEHLNIPAFRQFLADNGISGKPIWVTEVQYQQSHQTQDYDNEDFARILARSYIYALANGVDKLFYVNIKMPSKEGEDSPPFDERSALISDDGQPSALFYAHRTVVDILGALDGDDTVEIIRESVGEWHIEAGQYRFIINGQTVYALWGSGPLPAEITGQVRVIDITGTETLAEAAALTLTDSPVFVFLD